MTVVDPFTKQFPSLTVPTKSRFQRDVLKQFGSFISDGEMDEYTSLKQMSEDPMMIEEE